MYSPLRHIPSILWKRAPIQLTFFVTRKCNLRCPFCFYLMSADAPGARGPELALDEIEKISRSLGSLLWLAFSGGEIFLRDDLVEVSRIFYDNNRPAIMLYPTNGQLPDLIADRTTQVLEHCKRSVVVVKLSLDGLDGAHDAIRSKRGCFATTMKTYHLLGNLLDRYPHFELGINTVLCSENQHEMDGIIEFVRTLKNIKTHTISLVRGNLLDERYKNVDAQNYGRAMRRLEENLKKSPSTIYRFRGARIKAAQDIVQHRLIHRTMLARKRLAPCYAGRLNLVLTETGEVYPCEIRSESFGNVRDFGYDIGALIRSDRARLGQQAIRNGRCYCTHECYLITNILFNPKWYPTLAREYLRVRA